MSGAIDLESRRDSRPAPFTVRDAADFHGREVPRRDWLIPSVLIRRSITLLAGDGGVGKSLLCQQLQVAAALGADWLGLPIKTPISSYGYYCEDDEEEVHRRFYDICRHYGCSFEDLRYRVLFSCRVGEKENEIVQFRGKGDFGKPERTPVYGQIASVIKDYDVQLTVLDTISDIFAGNENIRYQVKAFITVIRGLSLINGGGVILTSHPSKSSMIDGSGFSGSTAWNGAVRNRLYLTAKRRKDDDGEDAPTDERVLKIMKSNYGPFGEKIRCRWQEGCFVLENSSGGFGMLDRIDAKTRLLDAARILVGGGDFLAATPGKRFSLTTRAQALPCCQGLGTAALLRAQEGLLKEGRLVIVEIGPPSRRARYIRPSDSRYAGEGEP